MVFYWKYFLGIHHDEGHLNPSLRLSCSRSITYSSMYDIHSLGFSTFIENYQAFLHSIYEKSMSHFAITSAMKLGLRMSFLRMFFSTRLDKKNFTTTWSSISINKSYGYFIRWFTLWIDQIIKSFKTRMWLILKYFIFTL